MGAAVSSKKSKEWWTDYTKTFDTRQVALPCFVADTWKVSCFSAAQTSATVSGDLLLTSTLEKVSIHKLTYDSDTRSLAIKKKSTFQLDASAVRSTHSSAMFKVALQIWCCRLSPNRKHLAVSFLRGSHSFLTVFEVSSSRIVCERKTLGSVKRFCFLDDARLFVCESSKLGVWHFESDSFCFELQIPASVSVSKSKCLDSSFLFEADTSAVLWAADCILAAAFRFVVVFRGSAAAFTSPTADPSTAIERVLIDFDAVGAVAIAPNGKYLCCASRVEVRVYHLDTLFEEANAVATLSADSASAMDHSSDSSTFWKVHNFVQSTAPKGVADDYVTKGALVWRFSEPSATSTGSCYGSSIPLALGWINMHTIATQMPQREKGSQRHYYRTESFSRFTRVTFIYYRGVGFSLTKEIIMDELQLCEVDDIVELILDFCEFNNFQTVSTRRNPFVSTGNGHLDEPVPVDIAPSVLFSKTLDSERGVLTTVFSSANHSEVTVFDWSHQL